MKAILAGLLLAAVTAPCSAQSGSDGWRALGEMLAGKVGTEGAYEEAYQQRMETEAAYWSAVRAKQEADAAEREAAAVVQRREMINELARIWAEAGLPADEAAAVAETFDYTPELDALVARGERDGSAKLFTAAWQAYREYRFLLANQLVVAAYTAQRGELRQPRATPVDSEPSDDLWADFDAQTSD